VDLLEEMDKVVMSLVEALEERQLLKDTIIVFTSDNRGLASVKNTIICQAILYEIKKVPYTKVGIVFL
jgi:membrane-anchored protein YejM (alkaline phosphatase superfamily)